MGVTACQYIFLAAFRFVRISLIISAASGPVSQSVGITVGRYSRTSGWYCRASIIGRRRRFYPSELRPSIIRKGRKVGNGRRKDEEEDNEVERPIEERIGQDAGDGRG